MKNTKSIRAKIVYATLIFTLILSFCLYITFAAISRQELVNSNLANKAYNIKFISSLIEADISNIDTLSKWCSINNDVKEILDSEDGAAWLDCYYTLQPTVVNNPSFNVLDRIIIMNKEATRFIQFLPQNASSRALSHENVIFELPPLKNNYSSIARSALKYPYTKVMKNLIPIVDHNNNDEVIGYVYTAIDVNYLFKNLYAYAKDKESQLSVKMGETFYRVFGEEIAITDYSTEHSKEIKKTWEDEEATRAFMTKSKGKILYTVATQIEASPMMIMETIQSPHLLILSSSYALIFPLLLLAILLFMGILTIVLNHLIYTPVKRLSSKLRETAKGDFSLDPTIETGDELGEIGHRINKLSSNVVSLLEEKVEDERKKQELEYEMLLSQVNPHFLYNTLNSIKWMAQIQKATGISEMVTSLSRLLKAVSKGKEQMITLEEEVALSREYMTIMKYRYGTTLQYNEEIDSSLLTHHIPRFSLQPILENSIFHGIEPKGNGCITLSIQKKDDCIAITIIDDGVGFDTANAKADKDSGMFRQIGLDNIQGRLDYAFFKKAQLLVESTIGKGTKVTIIIPEEIS